MNDQLILNEKEILAVDQTRYYQAVIFISSALYPLWGYLLSEKLGHYDPLGVRFAICIPLLMAAVLSFRLAWFTKNLKIFLYTSVFIAITHFHFILLRNEINMDYVVGGLIFLFTVVNIILESKFKIVFAILYMVMSFVVSIMAFGFSAFEARNEAFLYLFGVTTVCIFTFLNYLNYKKISTAFISEINKNTSLRRWSSVGQMAGGIAHEVNTPLATMILTLENLSDKLENNKIDQAKVDVANLIRTGEKIGNIVHSLRLLTMTGGKFERDRVSLFDVVISVKNDYAKKFKEKNIDFAYMYNVVGDGLVWGSSSSLKHVVSNLVKNAIDAIENKDIKWIKVLLIENKSHYKILVQNSGPLIDKNTAERVFEPFFSTKDVGTAMGIGLSISKTLVLAHGGTISLDQNNPNVMFEVALPKINSEKKQKNKMAA
ncbi:MAG: HAMP domain-containing sensor histidine kinase [Bdellovibrionota bacterium]